MRVWSAEEMAVLRRDASLGADYIADKLGRTRQTVYGRASDYGIRLGTRRPLTVEDRKVIASMPIDEAAKILGVTTGAITQRRCELRKQGIDVAPTRRDLNRYTDAEIATIIQLRRSHASIDKIASELNRTHQSIAQKLFSLRKAGVAVDFVRPCSVCHTPMDGAAREQRYCADCWRKRDSARGRAKRQRERELNPIVVHCVRCGIRVENARRRQRKYCDDCYRQNNLDHLHSKHVEKMKAKPPRLCIACGKRITDRGPRSNPHCLYCAQCRADVTSEQHARSTKLSRSDPDWREYRREQGLRWRRARFSPASTICQLCNIAPKATNTRASKYCRNCAQKVRRANIERQHIKWLAKRKDRFCLTCDALIPMTSGRPSLYCLSCRHERDKPKDWFCITCGALLPRKKRYCESCAYKRQLAQNRRSHRLRHTR